MLVAEDDIDIAKQYKFALELKGHKVTITNDGEECLKVYREALKQSQNGSPFDVVVLDYRMPGMNGMEAARQILETNPRQMLIFASAYVKELLAEADPELRQIAGVLEKPFSMKRFLEAIDGAIESRKNCKLCGESIGVKITAKEGLFAELCNKCWELQNNMVLEVLGQTK
ncbi:MAG: response regulator [Nitrososphaerales archaeon]